MAEKTIDKYQKVIGDVSEVESMEKNIKNLNQIIDNNEKEIERLKQFEPKDIER